MSPSLHHSGSGRTSNDSPEVSIGQVEAEMPVLKSKLASQKVYMSCEYRIS